MKVRGQGLLFNIELVTPSKVKQNKVICFDWRDQLFWNRNIKLAFILKEYTSIFILKLSLNLLKIYLLKIPINYLLKVWKFLCMSVVNNVLVEKPVTFCSGRKEGRRWAACFILNFIPAWLLSTYILWSLGEKARGCEKLRGPCQHAGHVRATFGRMFTVQSMCNVQSGFQQSGK